jgi:four helix bundle protein
MIESYKDLKVYQVSYRLAMEMFWLTKKLSKEEMYSLTDQIRRSTRSIVANVVEGWSKRWYENIFKRHLIHSIGSCDETKVWLNFALDCRYITIEEYKTFTDQYEELGKMLYGLWENWETYDK